MFILYNLFFFRVCFNKSKKKKEGKTVQEPKLLLVPE